METKVYECYCEKTRTPTFSNDNISLFIACKRKPTIKEVEPLLKRHLEDYKICYITDDICVDIEDIEIIGLELETADFNDCERNIFKIVLNDFNKLKDKFLGKGYYDCVDIVLNEPRVYNITNKVRDFVDVNYGVGCFTLKNINGLCALSNSIEVWDDLNNRCLGSYTIEECEKYANGGN